MTKNRCRFAWLILSSLLGINSSLSIELKAAPRTSVASVSSVSAESGTVTRIDAKNGTIVLDGRRRFAFSPASVIVRKQSNQRSSGGLAEVKEGAKVSLTILKNADSASPRVTEVWIAP
jgi:hypothetical protein